MQFSDIKANNRLQIECENDSAIYRNIRGIVLAVNDRSILLVSDFGELLEIHRNLLLSFSQISFPKRVSDELIKLKNYYEKRHQLETELKALKEDESLLKKNLYDANFLSKFNIDGAKNRLEKSIPEDLLNFKREGYGYKINFKAIPDDQIDIELKVSHFFEYYNLDKVGNVEKIIRAHAPEAKGLIEKAFPFREHLKEIGKEVIHLEDEHYSVQTSYALTLSLNEDNFLTQRDAIIKGFKKLRN